MKKYLFIFCYTILYIVASAINNNHITTQVRGVLVKNNLQLGDLLFQDLNCGSMCDGITDVTRGYHNTYISHVGMVVANKNHKVMIIEANGKGVVITPLNTFLQRSTNKNKQPLVMVGRIKYPYNKLIGSAIRYTTLQLGKPYNDAFTPNQTNSFYCSQLIYEAFKYANHDQPIFGLNIMDFTNHQTKKITHEWQEYFKSIHAKVPQGEIGTNPGMLSRESAIQIIYFYAKLRTHNN
jgi:uncharacterized protein YycO